MKDNLSEKLDQFVTQSSKWAAITSRGMARNTLYNLIGRLLPMLVALFTIPLLIDGLGLERFGVLTLIWLVVGYFGIFDMGIGRATTKFVAEAVANDESDRIPVLVWTPIGLQIILGIIGGTLLVLLTPWLVTTILNIPPELRAESRAAFMIMSVSLPFILCTSGARGVLEGMHSFGLVNSIRVPAGIFTFVAPITVLIFSNSLFHIALVLVVGRILVTIIHLIACFRSVPRLIKPQLPDATLARTLLGYGGWLTVSNLVGALIALGYIDRFMVSSLLDMSAVTYYSTPFEAVNKFLLPIAGLLGVLFPVFSAYAQDQRVKLQHLYLQSLKIVLFIMLPLIMVVISFAQTGLSIWLTPQFAAEAALVLQIISIGVLISSLSALPMGILQATGLPDLVAKLTLIEIPIYILLSFILTNWFGFIGTAVAWLIWQMEHTAMLFKFVNRSLLQDQNSSKFYFTLLGIGIFGLLIASFLSVVPDELLRLGLLATAIGGLGWLLWQGLLDDADRANLLNLLKGKASLITPKRASR